MAELETLYNQLSIGLCYLDEQLNVVRLNPMLAALGGSESGGRAGTPLALAFPPVLAIAMGELVNAVRLEGKSLLNREMKDGSQVWLLGCSPVRIDREGIEPGMFAGYQMIVEDITVRKHDEESLR